MVRLQDDRNGYDAGGEREPRGNGAGPSLDEPAADRLAFLSTQVEETVGLALELLRLRAARLRLRAKRRLFLVLGLVVFSFAALVASFAAVRLVASGLAAGLGELSGRPWLGELGAGVVLLASTALALAAARALAARKVLREFRERRDDAP